MPKIIRHGFPIFAGLIFSGAFLLDIPIFHAIVIGIITWGIMEISAQYHNY